MSFLNPWLLIGGLGIALPILAHLFNRHKVKETDWAAMQFLNRNVRVRSKQMRIQDLLLLVLRCLAILLFVFALSRPFSTGENSSALSGEQRSGVIIALDASFSMEEGDENSNRFKRALDQVKVISESIHPGDPVSLVLLGAEQDVIIRNMAFDANRFRNILFDLKAKPEALNLDNITSSLIGLVEDMEAPQKEVFIVSDIQEKSWNKQISRLRDGLKKLNENANVFIVPINGQPDNLAITNLDLVSGVLRKGTVARYKATVKNCGPNAVSNVTIQCKADGVQVDSKQINIILPGTSKTVSLFVPFHNSGSTRITAEINHDTLKTDNVRRVVAVVRDCVSVLCLDGTSGSAGRLLNAALLARNGGVKDEDYIVRSVPWLTFPTQDLEKVDVIVMANVPEITADQAKRLSKFVRNGNGLVWFGGDNIKASKWNEQGKELLPASIGQAVNNRDELGTGKPIDPSMPDHFVVRPLQSLPEDLISETRFQKHFKVEAADTSVPVLKLAGSDSPVLLEHSLGRGHVFMFTTSAETNWNNMALTPVFPMLMQKIVTYLAGREFEQPRVVGDSISLSYTSQPDANDAVFDTPSKQTINVPVRQYRNHYVAMLENAREAGFYTVRVSVQSAGIPVAVNVDTSESDITSLPEAELRKNLEDTGVTIASNEAELMSAIQAKRTTRSSSRFFIIAAIVILLLESWLANHFMKKRRPDLFKKQKAKQEQKVMSPVNMEVSHDA